MNGGTGFRKNSRPASAVVSTQTAGTNMAGAVADPGLRDGLPSAYKNPDAGEAIDAGAGRVSRERTALCCWKFAL